MVQASNPVPKNKLQLCDFQSYTWCGKKALSALYPQHDFYHSVADHGKKYLLLFILNLLTKNSFYGSYFYCEKQ